MAGLQLDLRHTWINLYWLTCFIINQETTVLWKAFLLVTEYSSFLYVVLMLLLCLSRQLFAEALQYQITLVKFLQRHRSVIIFPSMFCISLITWNYILIFGMGFRFKQCALITLAFCLLLFWIYYWILCICIFELTILLN